MKWPASLTMIRHGKSAYNALRNRKDVDPEYVAFKKAYAEDYRSPETLRLARLMRERYSLGTSDFDTPLDEEGVAQSWRTGSRLHEIIPLPDIVFCSPYLRAAETLEGICRRWRNLSYVKRVTEDRIREQEHGLSQLYSDWRIFHANHPEQKELRDLLGPYWYQYPQGESVPQVRDRLRDVLTMLTRECAGKHVVLVMHHLAILSMRANLERLTPGEFIYLDEHQKPVNCGVTHYIGDSTKGSDGRLILDYYNQKLY